MNAVTSLKYPVVFGGGERRVELDGEAYFEVAADSARAFVVEVGDMEVEVYGTSFDVTTFYEGEVRTVLVEGSVGVREPGSGKGMPDCPGTDGGVRAGGQKYCREGDGCHFVHCLERGIVQV